MKPQNIALLLFFVIPKAMALMDLNVSRGEQVFSYSKNEVCVIPTKFPLANYTNKDREHELELCQMDFNTNVGVCPKLHNTNPGLEIYKIPTDLTKASLEEKICDKPSNQREGNKIAKYKLSTSCSYTPSILAYYHVSRILGGLLMVPPAVLRTMDADTYLSIPQKGKKTLAQGGTIAATWKAVLKQLNNPTTDKRGPYLFTTDYQQTFGGLMRNAKGEAAWEEISNHAAGDQIERGKAFMKEQVYLDLINPAKASKIVGTEWSQKNVQRLRVMGDASDMLLMDYILRQEDRFNNIAYKLEVTGLVQSDQDHMDVKSIDVKKTDSTEELNKSIQEFQTKYPGASPAFAIRRIMLKDNDCGVAVESAVARIGIVEKLKMLESVRHLKKSTYDKLQKFYSYINSPNTASFSKNYFIQETMMTTNDYNQFALNVKRLAEGLKMLCEKGQLHLDLNIETHFGQSYQPGAHNCATN